MSGAADGGPNSAPRSGSPLDQAPLNAAALILERQFSGGLKRAAAPASGVPGAGIVPLNTASMLGSADGFSSSSPRFGADASPAAQAELRGSNGSLSGSETGDVLPESKSSPKKIGLVRSSANRNLKEGTDSGAPPRSLLSHNDARRHHLRALRATRFYLGVVAVT